MRAQAVQTVTRRLVGQQTLSESSLWSHPGLLAVCIALPMIEVGLLWGVGLTSALGIAPSVTAPVPFATFHDLRWLMVYHRSWLGFAVEALALLAFRGALTALLVRLAWPGGVARPSPAVLIRNATVFTLVSAVLLMPWVGLLFGLAVMPVSWLFFVAVPPVLAVGLLIHHGVVRAGWSAPAARTTGWVALTFAVLTLSGAALSASPAGLRLPVAAAAGLFNAWAWNGIVNVLALAPQVPRRAVPMVAIVAESEGALVAKTYLAATPGAPVDELVMLSPLVQPARVWYPERGASGWGLASGWELRELGGLFRDVSGADMSADMPVVRSLIDHGPAVRDLLACPLPGTRQLALFPLADAVATPHPSEIGIPSEVVPAFHGGLLADDRVRQAVSTYLEDGKVAPATVWPVAQEILRASAAAWQVPELPLTLNQDWNGPAGRSPSCDAMAASLREWLR